MTDLMKNIFVIKLAQISTTIRFMYMYSKIGIFVTY